MSNFTGNMSNPLLPSLIIFDVSLPKEKQQCILRPSIKAQELANKRPSQNDKGLRNRIMAIKEGKIYLNYGIVYLIS